MSTYQFIYTYITIVSVWCKNKIKIKENTQIQNKKNIDNDNLTILLTSFTDKQKIYDNDSSISLSDLRQHDIDILNILYDNEDENTIATFSFNGLKSILNIHQEILSRSLRRLQELGLIERTKLGYRSTKDGKMIFSKLESKSNKERSNQTKNTQILQVYVPYKLANKKIVQSISGKWFDNLRWVGMVQTLTGYQLKWKDIESSIEIVVYMSENNIIIETNDNPSDISKAFRYSTRIIESIGDIVTENNSLIYPIKNNDYNKIDN